MAFSLTQKPGFSDLPDAVLAAEQPALGLYLARIADNAAFGMVRPEFFFGLYKDGDAVNLPVSPVDGYPYQRNELLYSWGIYSTVNPSSGWISGPGALWFAGWKVDQVTGAVSCAEFYRKSEGSQQSNSGQTSDGVLAVLTIAQRQRSALTISAVPNYVNVDDSELSLDDPLRTTPLTRLSRDAKHAVVSSEVIYMGEFVDGDTVPQPVSPADGYRYSYGESKFIQSWRWTTAGSAFTQPDYSKGQLHRISASIDPTNGAVTTEILFYNSGVITTNYGRIAVFAFCQRTGAQVYQLTVKSTSMPWVFDGGINGSYDYGVKNGSAPTRFPIKCRTGQVLQISYIDGLCRMSSARPYTDAAGQSSYDTTTQGGSTGHGFPGAYLGGVGRLGRGVGAWVDDGGNVVQPEDVGLSATVTCPADDLWFDFGIDDDNFSDNVGEYNYAITLVDVGIGDTSPIPDSTGLSTLLTMNAIDALNQWLQPGDVGDSGGGDPHALPAGYMVPAPTPGDWAEWHSTPKAAFNNVFWYLKAGAHNDATDFEMSFDVKIPTSTDQARCRAIEWQIQQNVNDKIFNWAFQLRMGDDTVRTFTFTGVTGTGHWDDTGITWSHTDFDSAAIVNIVCVFHRDATTATIVSIKINGVLHTLNISQTAIAKVQADYVEPAFQLDSQASALPFLVMTRNMTVRMAKGGAPGTPGAIEVGPSSGVFAEIAESAFFPGQPLPYTLMRQINNNVKSALVRQEFFGPATFSNGQTVPLPVSPIDGYSYKRSELFYAWEIATTGPEVGGIYDIRFWEFDASVSSGGLVSIHEARNSTGGGIFNVHEGSVRVVTVGIRDSAQGPLFDPDADLDPRPPTDADALGEVISTSPATVISQAAGDATHLKTAALTVTFANGTIASYQARDGVANPAYSISDPGSTPQTYYITVYDPTGIGESAGLLTTHCDTTDTNARTVGFVFLGKIIATHAGGNTGSVAGPAGIDQPLLVVT
jgi:hypothetical protein